MPSEALAGSHAPVTARTEAQDPVYLRIRDLVYQTCGIYHSEEKLYLLTGACKRRMDRVNPAATKAREYLDRLTSGASRQAEIRELLNEITIGETCLFRSPTQLNALHNTILPELTVERRKMGLKRLRIWSAGCSTGEEPYTLSMFLLEEMQNLLKDWTFEIQSADSALSNVVQVLTRALTLGTEGANGTLTDADRQAIAGEVQGLLNQAVNLANTTYQGVYLFSGTQVGSQPFTLDPVTNTVAYNGDSNTISVELSNGNWITANVPGDRLFQNVNGSVFGALQDLYTSLVNGAAIPAAVSEVQKALSQVSVQRVSYGNALNQINLSESFLSQEKVNLSQQESNLVGADMAAVATNFSQAQVALQATLNATSRVLNLPTLLDYLK